MNARDFVRRLRASPNYRDQIVHVETIPARSASFAAPDLPLRSELRQSLAGMGIDQLYAHQAAAVNALRRGEHVVIATSTASGKTLCYNIPVVESVLEDSRARALYIYPTKALAQDQLGKLNELGFFPRVRFAAYDGDTPRGERAAVKRGAHIVLTNPDMLHVGILPYHSGWAAFLTNLKYVVIDEIHTYRGVFGAHVAEILRRLRRICARYGSAPQFVAGSATIANPADLMQSLTGLGASLIDEDGSPHGRRTFVFWNPPMLGDGDDSGQRRSAHVEATLLFRALVEAGIRNIVFAKARKSAELILRYAREQFSREGSDLSDRVASYRAGYTREERRDIERSLFSGDLIGVTATNALELGVDVGGLDATVLAGYPGTMASAWQQAGRAGRGREEALSFLVALDGPLDQYLMRHPDYFFGRVHEHAIVDPNNARILAAHLRCAAYEAPIGPEDLNLFGPAANSVLTRMENDRKLKRREDRWYFRGEGYPASEANIRSASADAYEIRERDAEKRLIGTVESARAYQTVHPGAIYLHQGESYVVEQLDEETRTAIVHPANANYYTEPRELTYISVLGERHSRKIGDADVRFGEVVVTSQVLGYRVKQLYSDTTLDVVDLDLPEKIFETEAFWFTVPPRTVARLAEEGCDLCGALHAAEHAAIGMMPLFSTCDRWDLGGVSTPNHPDTGGPAIFIYDAYPGGVGIAESTFHRLDGLLAATQEMIHACPCAEGCPSCVQSPKCGNNNEPLDKRGAGLLLARILQGCSAEQEAARAEVAA